MKIKWLNNIYGHKKHISPGEPGLMVDILK
jgi:hypothetical protein